jgi:hypothetical protein
MLPTKIQREALKKPCPHCEVGKLRIVNETDGEIESEVYLWCDSCELSMDSDGGYTY